MIKSQVKTYSMTQGYNGSAENLQVRNLYAQEMGKNVTFWLIIVAKATSVKFGHKEMKGNLSIA